MKRLLYLDASAGVSGDMFVGALLDLGADLEQVRAHVSALGVTGLEVRARRVTRRGIAGTKFDVVDPETGRCVDEGDHLAHHHGHAREHEHAHVHGRGHSHRHHHDHEHDRGGEDRFPLVPRARPQSHPHRGLADIRRILAGAGLPPAVAQDAVGVFERLAQAEAKVHATVPEAIHFHEVGALDAIADVVAAASAFRALGVDEVRCSPVHVGCGMVRCEHGVLPVPAPATLELLRGVPVYSDGTRGELCTPTGAALIRHFAAGYGPMPPLVIEGVGYGAGSKDFGIPNLFRATLGTVSGEERAPAAACAG